MTVPMNPADPIAGPSGRRRELVMTLHARRCSRVAGTTALTLSVAILIGAPAAGAVTAAFPSIGLEQQFTVPAGVHSILVTAVGASGGAASAPGPLGGRGATITDTLAVTPGELLDVEVGRPGNSGEFCCSSAFNGGGPGGAQGAGGGGGASDVRRIPARLTGTLTSRLIVAAGGGGGGAGNAASSAGADAGTASDCIGCTGGGGAATATLGGSGGSQGILAPILQGCDGNPGSLGIGGAGCSTVSTSPGGGGGGGQFGGGGGAGTLNGGGGGGGSSFSPADAPWSPTATDASVTITWVQAPAVTANAASLVFGDQAPGTVSSGQVVEVTNTGSAPLQVGSVTLTGADPSDFLVGFSACSSPIAVDASCAISVRFAPSATGARSATMQIPSNAPASPATVDLSGTAAAAAPTPVATMPPATDPAAGIGPIPSASPTLPLAPSAPIAPLATTQSAIPDPAAPISPKLSDLRLQPSRVKSTANARTTLTTITYNDTRGATTTFTLLRKVHGVQRGTTCVTSPRQRKPRQHGCTRLVGVGSFSHTDSAGTNTLPLTERVLGSGQLRTLTPALYVLRVKPQAGALQGPTVRGLFRVLR